MVGDDQLHVFAVETKDYQGPCLAMWCCSEGRYISNLQFGCTRHLGDKHSLFISLMDARWIVVRQSSLSSVGTLSPWSQREALSPGQNAGHTMGTHDKRRVRVAAGTRKEDKGALRQREKRERARSPGDAATEVAGQAEQLFCYRFAPRNPAFQRTYMQIGITYGHRQ